ncbi:hypothetical protein NQ314_000748 [Rhamnusium bicolor]|uniref:Myb/SANT-like DNA-binding domain-containing protein n=1 Tax=Rhamnusium bicolor TaxID=1586634 RepID=A0AAV8ZVA6_9CUCU|nr:hypothetical protein NQ314_000748 [Rhamnusium bicolor]
MTSIENVIIANIERNPDKSEVSEPYYLSDEELNIDTNASNNSNKRLGREKDFNRPKCKKNKLWSGVAKEMNGTLRGPYSLTSENCDSKYRNLLKTYKANKKKQNSSGESAINWEYFTDFDEILGCKASVQPPQNTIFDTMEIADEDNNNSSTQEDTETNENALEVGTLVDLVSEVGSSNTNKETSKMEEKERRKELFVQQKWEEEKQLRREETNAVLKLAEGLAKKTDYK